MAASARCFSVSKVVGLTIARSITLFFRGRPAPSRRPPWVCFSVFSIANLVFFEELSRGFYNASNAFIIDEQIHPFVYFKLDFGVIKNHWLHLVESFGELVKVYNIKKVEFRGVRG